MNKIEVSVICLTYNHEPYIEQCLSSLVGQVTTFRYRVIIHDDASTDGTREIVKRYAEEYPDLIVPIYQPENIYSKSIKWITYVEPYLEGKYIAYCEGDDWWTDPYKLQIQYDYMELHEKCSLVTHWTRQFDERTQSYSDCVPHISFERDLTLAEVIEGGGAFLGTNSLFHRREHLKRPPAFVGWGVGDYPIVIYLACVGNVHLLSRCMSCYRQNAKGSWTERINMDKKKLVNANIRIMTGLLRANEYMGETQKESIEKALRILMRQTAFNSITWEKKMAEGDRKLLPRMPLRLRLRYRLSMVYQDLRRNVRKVRRKER